MDEIKPVPSPWVIPGLEYQLPTLKLPENPSVFKDLVLEQIELRYGVTLQTLRSRNRRRPVSFTRQLFCYIMKDCYDTRASLAWLANIINKDHTSIIHSKDTFKDRLLVDDVVDHDVVARIQGEKFERLKGEYNYFKLILYKCIKPETILSAYQAILEVEKIPSHD